MSECIVDLHKLAEIFSSVRGLLKMHKQLNRL